MKTLRKVIFYTFLVSTISITAFAFWFFSSHPTEEQITEAFPSNSYQTFSNGKKLTLYSIEPFKKFENSEKFLNYSVISKSEIHDGSFQKFLKHAFLNDASTTLQGAACFNPRHGLRISDGSETLDILICYECGNFATIFGDKKGEGNLIGTSKALLDNALEKRSE